MKGPDAMTGAELTAIIMGLSGLVTATFTLLQLRAKVRHLDTQTALEVVAMLRAELRAAAQLRTVLRAEINELEECIRKLESES